MSRRGDYNPKNLFPIKKFLPSVVTLAGLCIGLTGVKMAFFGRFEMAVYMMLITSILDFVDGAVARALKSASTFGAVLDSLCDMVNFGVCSPMIMYIWGTRSSKLGWPAMLFFSVSMAIRLARFHVVAPSDGHDEAGRNKIRQTFFRGIPAPAGAMLNLTPLCAAIWLEGEAVNNGSLIMASIVVSFLVAAGLVSSIPTFSLKRVKVTRHNLFWFVLLTNATLVLFVFDAIAGILLCSVLYVLIIPFSAMMHKKMLRNV